MDRLADSLPDDIEALRALAVNAIAERDAALAERDRLIAMNEKLPWTWVREQQQRAA